MRDLDVFGCGTHFSLKYKFIRRSYFYYFSNHSQKAYNISNHIFLLGREYTMNKIRQFFTLFVLLLFTASSVYAAVPLTAMAAGTDIVYITKTGTKYHNAGCKSLSRSKSPISLADARRAGYQPCSICHSDRLQVTPAANTVQAAAPAKAAQASAASVMQAVSASSLTPAQAVQQAFAHYVQAGLDQNTALAKVQQNQARIITLPDDASIAAFVQSDLGSKVAVPAAGVATASSLTPEAVVQQAYAQLIRQGMTSDQAMAAINANLPTLLKNAGLSK